MRTVGRVIMKGVEDGTYRSPRQLPDQLVPEVDKRSVIIGNAIVASAAIERTEEQEGHISEFLELAMSVKMPLGELIPLEAMHFFYKVSPTEVVSQWLTTAPPSDAAFIRKEIATRWSAQSINNLITHDWRSLRDDDIAITATRIMKAKPELHTKYTDSIVAHIRMNASTRTTSIVSGYQNSRT